MNMAKYTKQLTEAMENAGLNYSDIARSMGKYSSTIKAKIESDQVSQTIDFIQLLGLRIVDKDGNDFNTNEPVLKPADTIQIGNLIFTLEQIEDLKKLLNG